MIVDTQIVEDFVSVTARGMNLTESHLEELDKNIPTRSAIGRRRLMIMLINPVFTGQHMESRVREVAQAKTGLDNQQITVRFVSPQLATS